VPFEFSDYLRGQQKVRLCAIVMVLFEVHLNFDLWTAGDPRAAAATLRMAITAALMFWMTRGSNLARWIAVVCISLGTTLGAIKMAQLQIFPPELVIQLVAQGYIVWKLVRDPQVRAFFRGLSLGPSHVEVAV
jgi:hypothetical protein